MNIMEDSIDASDELLNFFTTSDWPDVTKSCMKKYLCNNVCTDSGCPYGEKCQFSHHPEKVFSSKKFNHKLWRLLEYQRWVLKFPRSCDVQHMKLRKQILVGDQKQEGAANATYCTQLNDEVLAYMNRRDQLLLQRRQERESLARKAEMKAKKRENAIKRALQQEYEQQLKDEEVKLAALHLSVSDNLFSVKNLLCSASWLTQNAVLAEGPEPHSWQDIALRLSLLTSADAVSHANMTLDQLEFVRDLLSVCGKQSEGPELELNAADQSLVEKKKRKAIKRLATHHAELTAAIEGFKEKYSDVCCARLRELLTILPAPADAPATAAEALPSVIVTAPDEEQQESHHQDWRKGPVADVAAGIALKGLLGIQNHALQEHPQVNLAHGLGALTLHAPAARHQSDFVSTSDARVTGSSKVGGVPLSESYTMEPALQQPHSFGSDLSLPTNRSNTADPHLPAAAQAHAASSDASPFSSVASAGVMKEYAMPLPTQLPQINDLQPTASGMNPTSYSHLCLDLYKKEGGDCSILYGLCCTARLEPALFECIQCPSPLRFCVSCINSNHREGKNKLKRNHTFKMFCPGCFELEDLQECTLCEAVDDRVRCKTCHAENHERVRANEHAFDGAPYGVNELFSATPSSPGSAPTASPAVTPVPRVGDLAPPDLSRASTAPALLPETLPQRTFTHAAAHVHYAHAPSSTPTPVIATTAAAAGAVASVIASAAVAGTDPNAPSEKLQLMLNNARVRHLLEDVVHPLLVQAFKVTWRACNNNCAGCTAKSVNNLRVSHPVENIQLDPCVKCLMDTANLPSNHSARTAYTKATNRRVCEFEHEVYDVKAVAGILQGLCCMLPTVFGQVLSETDENTIVHWRNETFHPTVLPTALYERAFVAVPAVCDRIMASMEKLMQGKQISKDTQKLFTDWKREFGMPARVAACAISFARKDIEEHQRREWLREAERSQIRGLSKLMEKSNMPRNKSSMDLAKMLLSTTEAKVLVIPPFAGKADFYLLKFLTRIDWTAIIDLNDPCLWPVPCSDFAPRRLVTKVLAEMSWQSSILYCDRVHRDLWSVIEQKLRESLQVFVLAAGSFQQAPHRSGKLYDCLNSISSQCQISEWPFQFVPMFECLEDLLESTNFLWAESMGYVSAPADIQAKGEFLHERACTIATVGAYILASERRAGRCCILGVNDEIFGFSADLMDEYGGVELLVDGFDATPFVDSATDEDEAIDEAVRLQLQSFLCCEEVSWFLLKQSVVVERKQLRDLVERIAGKDNEFSVVTLVHGMGQGGTTMARHALYQLRQKGYVCMVVREPPVRRLFDSFVAVLQQIREAMGSGTRGVVLLIDMNKLNELQKAQMQDFTNCIRDRCHDYCLFLVTTSRRLHESQQQAPQASSTTGSTTFGRTAAPTLTSVLDLSAELTPEEVSQFSNLLKRCNAARPPIVLQGFHFPLDDCGMLDISAVQAQQKLREILGKCSKQELIDGGCTLRDVIALKLAKDDEDGDSGVVGQNGPRFPMNQRRRMPFFGLLAFLPQYRAATQTRVVEMVSELSEGELRVLKLCAFYSLFTSDLKVPLKLASLFYRSGVLTNGDGYKIPPFSPLSEMLRFDTVAGVNMLSTNFAYLVAEIVGVFGPASLSEGLIDPVKLKVSVDRVREYVTTELLPIVCGCEDDNSSENIRHAKFNQRQDILSCAADGLLEAFCEFAIWHPGCIPLSEKRVFSGKIEIPVMHESFLIEALLKRKSKHSGDQFQVIKTWFTKLICSFQHIHAPHLIFSTRASRFVAHEAMMRKNFELIKYSRELVEDFAKEFVVFEALGNVCKRHVQLLRRLYKLEKRNIEKISSTVHTRAVAPEVNNGINAYGALASDSEEEFLPNEVNVSGKGIQLKEERTRLMHLQSAVDIALEGYRFFVSAVVISQYKNSSPMIAAVQTLVACMECLCFIVCDGDEEKFVGYHQKPSSHPVSKYRVHLKRLQEHRFVEKCTVMLSRARNSNLRATESGSYEHSYKTSQTNKYIAINREKLRKLTEHASQKCYSREPIVFDLAEAKLMLVDGNRSSSATNTSALAWCVVTFECDIALRLTDTEAVKGGETSYHETLEKYFLASAMLAGRVVADGDTVVQRELNRYSDAAHIARPDVDRGVVTMQRLQSSVLRWIARCDKDLAPTADTLGSAVQTSVLPSKGASLVFLNNTRKQKKPAASRSYYGLEARLCLVMVHISQVLQQYKPRDHGQYTDSVERLRLSNVDLAQFAAQLPNSAVPRIFLAKNTLMPGNPFGNFIFLEDTELGIACKQLWSDTEMREKEYRRPKYQGLLTELNGEIIERDGRSYVLCDELGLTLGYHLPSYPTLKRRNRVTFVLGITDRGIRAYGIKVD